MSEIKVKKTTIYVKYVVIVMIMMLLGGGGMFALAKHRQRTFFIAKRAMIISHPIHQQKNTSNSFNSEDQQMMDTYSDIVEDPIITREARQLLPSRLKEKYSANNLSSMVDAKSSQQSLVLTVRTKASSKNTAIKITNAVSQAMKEKLPSIQPGAGTVRLLSPASEAVKITTPHMKKYIAVGLALGGMVGLIICFVDETWNRLI